MLPGTLFVRELRPVGWAGRYWLLGEIQEEEEGENEKGLVK